jgi:two-component system, sensor histidine kinase PdtaS
MKRIFSKSLILGIFTVAFIGTANGQSKLDSLDYYLTKFKENLYADQAKAEDYANKHLAYAKKLKQDTSITKSYYLQLSLASVKSDSINMIRWYDLMVKQNFDQIPGVFYTMNNAITAYFVNKGNGSEARKYIYNNLNSKLKSEENKAVAYANLGLLCNNEGKQDSNIFYLLKADNIANEAMVSDKTKMIINNYLLVAYYNISDYKNAVKAGEKAIIAAKASNFLQFLPDFYNNLIGSYIGIEDFKNASINLDSMKQYLSFNPAFENNYMMHKAELEKQNNNLPEAKKLLSKAYTNLSQDGNPFYLRNVINDLIKVKWLLKERQGYIDITKSAYDRCSDILETTDTLLYNKAIMYERLSKLDPYLADTLLGDFYKNEDFQRANEKAKLQELTQQYNEEKKIAENEILSSNLRRQKQINFGILAALCLLTALAYLLYRQRSTLKSTNHKLAISQENIKTLNKELNHRVKNNLAFMKSLLEMQSRRTSNEETKTLLKESETRLNALALVHARLFADQDNNTTVDLHEYLTEITKYLESIYQLPDRTLSIHSDYIRYPMDAEDAMRLGLIVNELITNSVKHAFADINEPTIQIKTFKKEDGQLALSYQDYGPSDVSIYIAEDKNINNSSLGLKLIALLREQLEDKVYVQIL